MPNLLAGIVENITLEVETLDTVRGRSDSVTRTFEEIGVRCSVSTVTLSDDSPMNICPDTCKG